MPALVDFLYVLWVIGYCTLAGTACAYGIVKALTFVLDWFEYKVTGEWP